MNIEQHISESLKKAITQLYKADAANLNIATLP